MPAPDLRSIRMVSTYVEISCFKCFTIPQMLPMNRPIYHAKLPPPCRERMETNMRICEYANVSIHLYIIVQDVSHGRLCHRDSVSLVEQICDVFIFSVIALELLSVEMSKYTSWG